MKCIQIYCILQIRFYECTSESNFAEPTRLHRKITKVEAMIDMSLYVHQIYLQVLFENLIL